jgi:leucyl aminopeptidase
MIPTSTDVSFQVNNKPAGKGVSVAAFVMEDSKQRVDHPLLTAEQRQSLQRLRQTGAATGKLAEVRFDLPAGEDKAFVPTWAVGLGKQEKINTESIRQAGAALARACRKHRLNKIAIVVAAVDGISVNQAAEAVVIGFLLASFDFTEFKGTGQAKGDDSEPRSAVTVTLLSEDSAAAKQGLHRGQIIADGQNFARTIASRPGNVINPPALAKVAQQMAKEVGLACRVLDEKQMQKLGMGGILAVGSASATPPRMIIFEHKIGAGKKQKPPLMVVGKAITFDTGGVSIKPADKMGRMVYDKCGAMTVLGLMYILAKLNVGTPVVGIMSSAENTLGGTAYRPGDILKLYNGVTVEVTNTDAEGRLVLADALAWGIETYKPSAVIDLATLTGGVIVALGSTMAGVMGNSDELVADLQAASEKTCEKFWRLPLNDDHRNYIKSDHADIVNSGGREGSPLQGAAFLSFFVPRDDSVPWAHFDIAGVADTEKVLPCYGKGATGWGVRTLLEWIVSQ